jgi:hypothetical protein
MNEEERRAKKASTITSTLIKTTIRNRHHSIHFFYISAALKHFAMAFQFHIVIKVKSTQTKKSGSLKRRMSESEKQSRTMRNNVVNYDNGLNYIGILKVSMTTVK